jgi:hypothetical protein
MSSCCFCIGEWTADEVDVPIERVVLLLGIGWRCALMVRVAVARQTGCNIE